MTNILRKVMSIRNLNETASPPDLEDEDTVVDMEEPNDVGSIAIPNFAEEGVTDHTEILVE